MPIVSPVSFLIRIVLIPMTCFLMFLAGCRDSKAPPRPFRNPPVSLLDQVKWVCNHGDFTQFVVRERVVYAMSKTDGTPYPLGHKIGLTIRGGGATGELLEFRTSYADEYVSARIPEGWINVRCLRNKRKQVVPGGVYFVDIMEDLREEHGGTLLRPRVEATTPSQSSSRRAREPEGEPDVGIHEGGRSSATRSSSSSDPRRVQSYDP